MKTTAKALTIMLFLAALSVWSQDLATELHPPKGAKVAIVVFEDLQCPLCRQTAPLLKEAGKTYKIPVVRHDFPLPMHNWSFEATVTAHYFDAKSRTLGLEYRDYIFEHQPEITPQNLRSFSDKFAADHKMALPFVIDPQGKLAAEVRAERDLGTRIGLHQTPTIYVVSSKPGGKPYVEVTDRSQLYQMIDAMERD
ncbi:MAG: DsbA family protein [Terriglobales bacterium]|jgi:protein-disulfide isomerase|nr:thioredoxin domain-containing protein [Terriglobales bacterium]